MSTVQASSSSNPAQPQPQQAQESTPEASQPVNTRHAEEQARKDRTLTEFMLMLDDYEPMVCLQLRP
jgi:transcription initiation factor TFIID subunit 10